MDFSHPIWRGPAAAGLVLALSAAIVGTALVSQHWGGLEPCILCYYQRYPWYAVIALMLVALVVPRLRAPLLWTAAALLVLDVGIAAYHIGVEHKVFEGPSACASGTITAQTLDALRAQLAGKRVVRCDEPAWTLFGVSMAGYNLLAAAGVALLAAHLALKQRSRA
jgi:disulfide bond formation protein DsbB